MDKESERRYFGTDGIRGVANEHPMTSEVALALGRALAFAFRQVRPHPKILVGKDTRLSGYMLETALASGITSMGADVLLVGPMPAPGVAFLTQSMRASAGVMISASHNPFPDNGIKVFDEQGYKLTDEREAELERILFSSDLDRSRPAADGIGKAFRVEEAKGRFIEFLKRSFPKELSLEGVRVGIDCAHGAAYEVAPTIFQELGAEVNSIGVKPNGLNINEGCGALAPTALATLVKEKRLDVGIALDGDGDRVIFVDEKGRVVDGDAILAVCAEDLMERGDLSEGVVVGTVMNNFGLEDYLSARGARLLRTAVGDRYIMQAMRQHGYTFGGEPSGHIIFHHYSRTGDGILAALQVLALMGRRSQSLAEVTGRYVAYPQVLRNVPVRRKHDLTLAPLLQKKIREANEALGKEGRLLVRPSGTEPLIRVMVEGADRRRIETIADEIASVVAENLS